MRRYRFSQAAKDDLVSILAWTHQQFGSAARQRYEALIVAALRDVAADPQRPGSVARPELGAAVRSWPLRLSRHRTGVDAAIVRRPRHVMFYRVEGEWVVIGRVLHEAMEWGDHLGPESSWS